MIDKDSSRCKELFQPEAIVVQSAAKLFEHLRQYLLFFSGLITNFYHPILVKNNKKSVDHDLTNLYFIKLH